MKNKTYELLYDTQEQFNTAQGNSGNVTSVTPGVAYIVENRKPAFNRKLVNLLVEYYITDVTSATKIYDSVAVKTNLREIIVDKTHIPASAVTNTYQFTETGLHKILFRYANLTSIPNSAFSTCPEIISFKIPKTVTKIGDSGFKFCTGIKTIDIPDWCTYLGNAAFEDCSGITKVSLPANVSIGTGTIRRCAVEEITLNGPYTDRGDNCFSNEWNVKRLNLSSLNDYCSSTGLNHVHASPTSVTDKKVHVYDLSVGTEITNINIPSGTTLIGWGMFRKWAFATTLSIPDSVVSIGRDAFAACENLNMNLILPSGLTSIGWNAFSNCPKLTGNLVIPSTTTSIGQGAFENCSGFTGLSLSENLTSIGQTAFKNCKGLAGCSVVVPSGVTTLTGNTFTGDELKNLTVYGDFYGPSYNTTIGDGTGTIEVYGNYKFCWSNGLNFKDIIIHGDFIHCGSNGQYGAAGYFLTGSRNVETFRCEGTYSGHTSSAGILDTYGGEPNLKFFEILGDCIGKLFYNTASVTIGIDTIIHFGYDGVITNKPKELRNEPSQERFDPLNRVLKFYVGDGSSQAHDQAILNRYLQDADWAEYSDKLDIWYNYHGEYRQE